MEKNQIISIRKKYKGQPMLFICDNEHNFFENYPYHCMPIWDDDNELVTFMETNMESSGFDANDFPFVVSVTSYDQIQSVRVFTDRKKIIDFLEETKSKVGEGAFEHAKEVVSQAAHNTKIPCKPYYADNR